MGNSVTLSTVSARIQRHHKANSELFKLDRQYFCLSNEIPFRPSALFQQWLSGAQAASPPRQRTARS